NVVSTSSITVTPGVFDPTTATLGVGSSSVASNTTTVVTLTAYDHFGRSEERRVGEEGVALSLSTRLGASNAGLSAPAGCGCFTSPITAYEIIWSLAFRPALFRSNVTATASITVTPGVFDPATATLAVGSSSVASNTTTVVTLTAYDHFG